MVVVVKLDMLWLSHNLLLPSKLHHLPVRVGMLSQNESRTRSRSIFRYKPTRFKPDSTCVTQRLRPEWTGPPLWRLIRCTVSASPHPSFRRLRCGLIVSSSSAGVFFLRLEFPGDMNLLIGFGHRCPCSSVSSWNSRSFASWFAGKRGLSFDGSHGSSQWVRRKISKGVVDELREPLKVSSIVTLHKNKKIKTLK